MAFTVNVPDVAGVPPVNFAVGAASEAISLLTGDLVSQFSAVFGPQWGIFLNGEPVITAESVVGFEFRNDWTISDYPIEGGVFESYDKVLLPFLAKVRFAAGSNAQTRQNLLIAVAAAAASFEVYDVVTPEFTYIGANISHYDYRREAQKGVGLIVVDVWLSQVIIQNQSVLPASQVQNPASADTVSGGSVTAQPVSSSVSAPAPGDSGS